MVQWCCVSLRVCGTGKNHDTYIFPYIWIQVYVALHIYFMYITSFLENLYTGGATPRGSTMSLNRGSSVHSSSSSLHLTYDWLKALGSKVCTNIIIMDDCHLYTEKKGIKTLLCYCLQLIEHSYFFPMSFKRSS